VTFIEKGKIRITRHGETRRIKKSSYILRVGDQISFLRGTTLLQVEVTGFPHRRGPAVEARTFYTLGTTQTCDSQNH